MSLIDCHALINLSHDYYTCTMCLHFAQYRDDGGMCMRVCALVVFTAYVYIAMCFLCVVHIIRKHERVGLA